MDERAFLDHIFNENIGKVKEVIESNNGLGLNFINKELNTTPLICAIDAVNPEIVELLLNKGSNPNLGHNGLSLPLYHAIELAEEAADYDRTDDPKLLLIIELLIKNGADMHLANYNGKSSYQYAESRYLPAKKMFDLK